MKKYTLMFLLLMRPISLYASDINQHNYIPDSGYIPDQATAIKIAIAILSPIYGEDNIKKHLPYNVQLKQNTWVVQGSLHKGSKGGVPLIHIHKKSGRIIRVSHGK